MKGNLLLYRVVLILFSAFVQLELSGQWGQRVNFTDNASGNWIMADMNGDGVDELIFWGFGILVRYGQEDGSYIHKKHIATPGFITTSVLVEDLNGDGFKDILAIQHSHGGTESQYRLIWFKGNGTDIFAASDPYILPFLPTHFHVNDYNSDGWPDIYVPGSAQQILFINEDGMGFQATDLDLDSASFPNYSADIDGDGFVDIISVHSGVVSYWANDGFGFFGPKDSLTSVDAGASKFQFFDYDSDGDLDIIYYVSNSGIKARKNDGNQSYSHVNLVNETSVIFENFVFHDLDLDGEPDLVAGIWNSQNIPYKLYKNFNGGFIAMNPPNTANLNTKSRVNVGHVNGDGYPDILFNGNNSTGGLFANPGTGTVNFGSMTSLVFQTFSHRGIVASDFSGNGNPEIIVSDSYVGGGPYQRTRTCLYQKDFEGKAYKRKILKEFSGSSEFNPQLVTDWNGDGKADVVGTSGEGTVTVLLNMGNLDFEWMHLDVQISGMLAQFTHFGDLDGDGFMDVLIRQNNQLHYRLNDGFGGLNDIQSLSLSLVSGFSVMAVEDFNGNGLADVFVREQQQFRVVWNLGDGLFELGGPFGSLTTQQTVRLVKAVDIDGDGLKDVMFLTTDVGSNTKRYYWAKNLSENPWMIHPPYTANYIGGKYAFELWDFDGDGDLDLLTADDSGNLTWIVNQNGNFSYQLPVGAGEKSNFIGMIRMDGDANYDIVLADNSYLYWIADNRQKASSISGKVFFDENLNQVYDEGETLLDAVTVQHAAGGGLAMTNAIGNYTMFVSPGSHEIGIQLPPGWTLSGGDGVHSVDIPDEYTVVNHKDFGLKPMSDAPSLISQISLQAPVCNQTTNVWVSVQNNGGQNLEALAAIHLSPLVDLVSCVPTPDSITNNVLYVNLGLLEVFQVKNISIHVKNPGPEHLGNPLDYSVTSCKSDYSICNSKEVSEILLCAYDPNDKLVTPVGTMGKGYITSDNELTYTVRFQNTGNYVATDVIIIDTLSPWLEWSSVKFIASSHHLTSLNVNAGGVARFYFNQIFLPDSSSAPELSIGFISFSVLLKPEVPLNAVIANRAGIYFDSNPPIITNTVSNRICSTEIPIELLPLSVFGQNLSTTEIPFVHYQWLSEDEGIVGTNDHRFKAEYAGNYKVLVTDEQGCLFESKSREVDFTDLPLQAELFPNPSRGSGQLLVFGAHYRNLKVHISNATGERLAHFPMRTNPMQIDTFFPAGLYFVSLIDDKGKQLAVLKWVIL